MPKLTLDLSEDTVEILTTIGHRMGVPEDLPTEEYLEVTIAFLADSVDAQIEVSTTGNGTPLAMEDALQAVMNPDISTNFVQPQPADTQVHTQQLTLEEIKHRGGLHGKSVDDALMQEAIRIVYSSLDEDEWDTNASDRLVTQTVELLQAQLEGRTLGKHE